VIVVLLAALAGFVTHRLPAADARAPGPLAIALASAAVLGAGATLRWRIPGFVVVAAALGAYVGREYPDGPIYAAGLAVMFVLGRRSGRALAIAGLIALEVALLAAWLVTRRNGWLVSFYPGGAAAAGAVGAALRSRRFGRDEETRRRLAEERLRIARDLHDGVAHAMATINVQAAAAAHVLDRQPAAAKQALSAIADASATVLGELNALLTLLREPGAAAERAPTPGLAEVADLVTGVRAAGRECDYAVEGDVGTVSPAVATAVYRIVQESLTNVLKHAGAARVDVHVQVDGPRVTVTVADDGSAPGPMRGPVREGNGLRGMRERAEATGGRLTAGPGPAGFTVRAEWGPA